MEKNDLLTKIRSNKKYKDYSYLIFFFLISSFFIFFVIGPVVKIAVSLRKEATELRSINKIYEKNIGRVIELQTKLEEVRDKKTIIMESLPHSLALSGIIQDVVVAASNSAVRLNSFSVANTQFQDDQLKKEVFSTITVELNVSGSYTQISSFISEINSQRRLKTIGNFSLQLAKKSKDVDSAMSATLTISAYHL